MTYSLSIEEFYKGNLLTLGHRSRTIVHTVKQTLLERRVRVRHHHRL